MADFAAALRTLVDEHLANNESPQSILLALETEEERIMQSSDYEREELRIEEQYGARS